MNLDRIYFVPYTLKLLTVLSLTTYLFSTCLVSFISFLIFMTSNLYWLSSVFWYSITHLLCMSSQFLTAALTLRWIRMMSSQGKASLLLIEKMYFFLANFSVKTDNFHSSFMPIFSPSISLVFLFCCWEISSLPLPSVCPHLMQSSHGHYHL